MANTSIQVYALQRVPLVLARKRKSIEIKAQMQRIEETLNNVNSQIENNDRALKLYYDRILEKELEKTHAFLHPEAEYLGLARQMIFKFMKKNFGV